MPRILPRPFLLALLPSPGLLLFPGLGLATTHDVSATGFTVAVEREIAAPPHRVWSALQQVDHWWDPQHTWSGNARNLSLVPRVGGCFCERWPRAEVEHGRVINATEDQLLRLQAPLGPLQALPVNAVLSFEITATTTGTKLAVTYAVAGDGTDLSKLAPVVDGVITAQVDRLVTFIVPPRR